MQMMIEHTEKCVLVFFPLLDRKTFMLDFPYNCLTLMDMASKEDLQNNMLSPYPCGDFDKILNKNRPLGVVPKFELEARGFAVPAGIVIEIRDHISGEIARSKAIPRSAFNTSCKMEV